MSDSSIMALDVGERTIGVAVSDERGRMALPLETVETASRSDGADRVARLVDDYEISEIVVGWPLDMQGREGRAVDRVRRLVEILRDRLDARFDQEIPIRRFDERLTTSEANRLLRDADVSNSRRKEAVDQVAACKILERFLASRDEGTTPES